MTDKTREADSNESVVTIVRFFVGLFFLGLTIYLIVVGMTNGFLWTPVYAIASFLIGFLIFPKFGTEDTQKSFEEFNDSA